MGLWDLLFGSINTKADKFFVASFTMLGKMAAADGRISDEEKKVIKNFMVEYLVMTPQEEARAIRIFENAYKDGTSFNNTARSFFWSFRRRPVMLDMLFDMLLEVSIADGEISPEEDLLLQQAAKQFHFKTSHYEHLKSLHQAGGSEVNNNTYYLRLGAAPDATNEEIKAKYLRLSKRYTCDAVLGSGVPEVFINIAGKKLEDIEEAYSFIKLERGLNDD